MPLFDEGPPSSDSLLGEETTAEIRAHDLLEYGGNSMFVASMCVYSVHCMLCKCVGRMQQTSIYLCSAAKNGASAGNAGLLLAGFQQKA